MDFSSFTSNTFSFFEYYFRYINWKHQKYEQNGSDYVILSFDLIGINNLWKIALEAIDPKVGKQAIDFLINLNKNVNIFLYFKIFNCFIVIIRIETFHR